MTQRTEGNYVQVVFWLVAQVVMVLSRLLAAVRTGERFGLWDVAASNCQRDFGASLLDMSAANLGVIVTGLAAGPFHAIRSFSESGLYGSVLGLPKWRFFSGFVAWFTLPLKSVFVGRAAPELVERFVLLAAVAAFGRYTDAGHDSLHESGCVERSRADTCGLSHYRTTSN